MAVKTSNAKHARLSGSFERLVRFMPPMAIRDDVQYANTVEVIDRLMQLKRLTKGQSHYLETLLELVEVYEARYHSFDLYKITGAQMLKHVLEQSGMSGSDLGRLLNMHPTMGSKVLNGSRKLTWEHAKVLGMRFKVAPALFMD